MEPKPPQSSTPLPPAASAEQPPSLHGLPAACPVCGQVREDDDRYCEACGHDFTAPVAAASVQTGGLRGPLLWLFVLFWAALGVGGLIWLYNGLYRL